MFNFNNEMSGAYFNLYLIYKYLNKHKNYTRRMKWYKARKLYLKGYRVTVKTNL